MNRFLSLLFICLCLSGCRFESKLAQSIKKSSVSALSGFSADKGMLQPSFDPAISEYLLAPVPYSSTEINIVLGGDADISATVNGNSCPMNRTISCSVPRVGNNVLLIETRSADGTTSHSYRINVFRCVPVFKSGAGDISGYTHAQGEDGHVNMRKGQTWPEPRFTTIDSDTVRDELSGLIWEKKFNSLESDVWVDAVAIFAAGFFYGFNDWHVPNRLQMSSLLHFGKALQSSWLTEKGFTNVELISFWTCNSDMRAGQDSFALTVDLDTGHFARAAKSASNGFIAVRGNAVIARSGQKTSFGEWDDGDLQTGVVWPEPRFFNNGDGTITDNLTGLVWLADPSAAGKKTWPQVMVYTRDTINTSLKPGNAGDWRAANIIELNTLLNFGAASQSEWLRNCGFTVDSSDTMFWSSTTSAANFSNGWRIDIGSTLGDTFSKDTAYYFWPVRDFSQQ